MESTGTRTNHIAIVYHPEIKTAKTEADLISAFLSDKKISVSSGVMQDEEISKVASAGDIDILIALGGDGTMLRAGHLCGPTDIPILGINLGKFGFLTEVKKLKWQPAIERLLAGDYWLEKRMMLRARLIRDGEQLGSWDVLNEIVITRGQFIRPIHLTAYVDDHFLATYVADGIIASTATGSTAYALAAGGPILPPELRNILLIAVAPHFSVDRAIVLAEGSQVRIKINNSFKAVFSPDGQNPIHLLDEDAIVAFASPYSTKFVRFNDPGYFYRNITNHMSQNPSAEKHHE